jgi:hypothetical protein
MIGHDFAKLLIASLQVTRSFIVVLFEFCDAFRPAAAAPA